MNRVVGVINMAEVILRYRLIVLALALVLIAVLIWIFISKQESNEIPSRGVFVQRSVDIRLECV
jgi:hypothetical protein